MSLPARIKKTLEPGKVHYSLRLLNHERVLEFDNDACVACGLCVHVCPIADDVISMTGDDGEKIIVDIDRCVHCGTCAYFCVSDALTLKIDGEERIELREPAGDIERHSLPDFTGVTLEHKDTGEPVKKYLSGSIKIDPAIGDATLMDGVNACPTGALLIREDGAPGFEERKCFFCDACSIATKGKIAVTRTVLMMDFSEGVPPLIKRILERLMGERAAARILKGNSTKKGMSQTLALMKGKGKES
ncbi:4Fe-4S dicluster domain-containing protein [Candidatus Bathyarchaeota archaeon]|nr:4Fe-4S dicluster domain-containing protein [Candidatus Bathyarchaeota archaeon]